MKGIVCRNRVSGEMTSIRGLESHLCDREVLVRFDNILLNQNRSIHIKPKLVIPVEYDIQS